MRKRRFTLLACAASGFALFAVTTAADGQEVTGQDSATTGSGVPKTVSVSQAMLMGPTAVVCTKLPSTRISAPKAGLAAAGATSPWKLIPVAKEPFSRAGSVKGA